MSSVTDLPPISLPTASGRKRGRSQEAAEEDIPAHTLPPAADEADKHSIGFYLNRLTDLGVPDVTTPASHLSLCISLSDVFSDGTFYGGEAARRVWMAQQGIDRMPAHFPGIVDALLANYITDYTDAFLFEQCPSLYQATGRLLFLSGDSAEAVAAQAAWMRAHLGELADRTAIVRLTGLFRAPDPETDTSSSTTGGGVHHSKFMLLHLADRRLRLVIHTANDIEYDWMHKCQGVFVHDMCLAPAARTAPPGTMGHELMRYLSAYVQAARASMRSARPRLVSAGGAAALRDGMSVFVRLVQRADFRALAHVHVVASVPGWHAMRETQPAPFGYPALATLVKTAGLRQRSAATRVIIQCSSLSSADMSASVSSAGAAAAGPWFTRQFLAVLMPAAATASVHLMWPTVEQVRSSLEGYRSGIGLLASAKVFTDRPNLSLPAYLAAWNAEWSHRQRIMPHIKTIAACRGNHGECDYCYLGSANATPAAWGALQRQGQSLRCMNWELGVLWVSAVGEYSTNAPILWHARDVPREPPDPTGRRSYRLLPLPYDSAGAALTRYRRGRDQPWVSDRLELLPDAAEDAVDYAGGGVSGRPK